MGHFVPNGIVSLLTDFGTRDDYVGVMHAALLNVYPAARIVDLCHDIYSGDVEAAAFLLMHDYAFFPRGTVHVAVVDPGVGSDRDIIAAHVDDHVFLAPDNGLLHPLLTRDRQKEVFKVENDSLFLPEVSNTFHGRDIFAPVAGRLAAGLELVEVGRKAAKWNKAINIEPEYEGILLTGRVMWIDRFGNLITNLPFDTLESRKLQIAGIVPRPVRTFSEGKPGEPVCLVGSRKTIEIVIKDGDAAKTLGIGVGTVVKALS